MTDSVQFEIPLDDELRAWARIGIGAGLVACFAYPTMILVALPRIPQVMLAASFGPALAVASVALAHILRARRRAPSIELGAICNALAGALVTVELMPQLAINYSTQYAARDQLATLARKRLWDVILGLDVAFDAFIALGTLLFAINMIRDPRFGRIIGWIGVLIATVMLYGANIYYFPDPPYVHGFPHVGIATGLWYLAVVLLFVRMLRRGRVRAGVGAEGGH